MFRTGSYNRISIHAPSRERPYGQSFSRVGERFQSTLPHGSDAHKYPLSCLVRYFNPRSLTGATRVRSVCCKILSYFNPRSLTGATAYKAINRVLSKYFNPRSLTGATYVAILIIMIILISIHAPSRERRLGLYLRSKKNEFQSTLPHGSDFQQLQLQSS